MGNQTSHTCSHNFSNQLTNKDKPERERDRKRVREIQADRQTEGEGGRDQTFELISCDS